MRVVGSIWTRHSRFGLWWCSMGGLEKIVRVKILRIGTREGGGGRVSQFWLIRGVGNDGAIKNYNGYLHANIYPRSV